LGKEIGVYKWLECVQAKGADARNHIGMTVQRAIEIMEQNGLESFDYGFICHDEWEDSYEVVEAEYGEIDGEIVEVKPETTKMMSPAGDRFSFRMDELYAFIAAGFEARLAALEGEA
jgi:hypothetical protein